MPHRILNVAEHGMLDAYEAELKARGFSADPAQRAAAKRLQRLYTDLLGFKAARRTKLRKLLARPPMPRSVYFWGGVGRGKSFLMDCFYEAVPYRRKRRVHFHAFMQEVQNDLKNHNREPDPLQKVADRIAAHTRLLCFDEFHVSDIADAMILGRYLEKVMDLGVQFVMTSNYHPEALYPNGLQRERFLPAIALLQARLDVVEVDGGQDYRRLKMEKLRVYHAGAAADAALGAIFEELKDVEDEKQPLDVEGRRIPYRKRAGGLVWFDFAALCGGPRSYADYVDLAQRFHTVLLSGVPRMGPRNADAARRFTWLVDVFYDDRVKLFVGAEAPPDELFTEGGDAKTAAAEFARTASRLAEMQTADYLQQERRRESGQVQGIST